MVGFTFLYLIFNILFLIKGYFQLKAIIVRIIFNINNNKVEINDNNKNEKITKIKNYINFS